MSLPNGKFYITASFIATMLFLFCASVHAQTIPAPAIQLHASWYSCESLKKEGTWKHGETKMANGQRFSDNNYTCATRLFPLGTILRIKNTSTGKETVVIVSDRIGKRFAKTRIDLSKKSFQAIADLRQGVIPVTVEVVK
jgi:rare lipoprotein A